MTLERVGLTRESPIAPSFAHGNAMTALWVSPVAIIGLGAVYGRIVVHRRVRRGDPATLWRLEAVLGTATMGVVAGVEGAFAIADGSRRSEVGGAGLVLSGCVFLGWAAWIAWWTRGDGWLSPPSRRPRSPRH